MTSTKDILIEARGLLDNGRRWGKRTMHSADGRYCVMGALHEVCDAIDADAYFKLTASLPPGYVSIVEYNDFHGTRTGDIIRLFDRAIDACD